MTTTIQYIIEYGVLGVLLLLSFVSVWLGIERWLYYKSVKPETYGNKIDLEIDVTNNLTIISTIAANAVYIGLLGTVLGIMLTFASLGQGGIVDSKTIMTSLSFTLIATAAGLCVAIPAIIIYNFLARKVEVLLALWDRYNGAQA